MDIDVADSLFLRTILQALIKSETSIREVNFDRNAFEAPTINSRSKIFDLVYTDKYATPFIVDMQLGLLMTRTTLWPDGVTRVVLSGRKVNQP